jgi:hypothetical protein
VAEILPRFYRRMQKMEDERKLAELILEGQDVENESGLPLRRSADGHNRDRLRGVPMIGRGIGPGATHGSDPLQAVLRKEASRRS